MPDHFRKFLPWIILGLVVAMFLSLGQGFGEQKKGNEVSYSQFLQRVESDRVDSVTMKGNAIEGRLNDGTRFSTFAPDSAKPVEKLRQHDVRIQVQPSESGETTVWSILISWFPMLLLIGVVIYFMSRARSGAGGAMQFGKSKAKMLTEDSRKAKFEDVAGIDEAKQELEEIVDYLRDPGKFQRLGGEIPRGMLLVGPPGTGKTLLARAIAGEAEVPFFTISGSDFIEMFVGVGASRVRDMFEQAKKNSPCIVFIDELDALGRKRGAGLGGGNDEREQTLNQLLAEMDGFEKNEGVIIVAATNRPDVLDPALMRPGRFDRQVVVPNPDVLGREQILRVHVRKVPLSPDVDLKVIARGTPGFSGADLANLVNEASLIAARATKRVVTQRDFEMAKDKLLMGAEKRSMVMDEEEKERTAYHEAGHALVSLFVPGNDPLHKITIIPRGQAMGVTMALPEKDRYGYQKNEITARLAMMFGGRVAEEIIYGHEDVTTGAGDDIKKATELAQRMVTEWGMSERLGPLRYAGNDQEVFLGDQLTRESHVSEHTARLIDEEVRRLIDEAESRAKEVLGKHLDDLHRLTKALLEYETLGSEDVQKVLKGEDPGHGDSGTQKPDTAKSSASVPSAGKGKPRDEGGTGGDWEPEPQPT
ncbi:ATP-dependent zinc metalloprotease FtsH [Ferruginivarius sediminum]|uniref:ATP-dependent zinc metalloprotease FtsH n=1 Tax=Ferruginivarius sediminum TaxID=2661937 RepID=A0A369TER9_9PROT|nr:ATP-dependent zinc metalloprotease FtsH [Ferruginivarius sediminum]RDD63750.1 ATP-dependent metallopeptidase FtsH/Yme1/Tma family protein [Ferruginivarius sediminum]